MVSYSRTYCRPDVSTERVSGYNSHFHKNKSWQHLLVVQSEFSIADLFAADVVFNSELMVENSVASGNVLNCLKRCSCIFDWLRYFARNIC